MRDVTRRHLESWYMLWGWCGVVDAGLVNVFEESGLESDVLRWISSFAC